MYQGGLDGLNTIPQVMAQYRESMLPALISEEGTLTFRELIEDAERIALCLYSSGIRKGDRVVLSIRRSPDYIRAWLGTLFAGAVQVTFHDGWPGQLREAAMRDCGPSMVIDEAMVEKFRAHKVPKEDVFGISKMIGALKGSDPFQIVYTSGSTGKPKGVVNSHFSAVERTLAGFSDRVPEYFVKKCDRLILDCSLGFVLSSWCICLCLLNEKTIVLPRKEDLRTPASLKACIDRYHADTIHITPSHFLQYRSDPAYAELMPRIRLLLTGGEPLSDHVASLMSSCGCEEVIVNYGASELFGPYLHLFGHEYSGGAVTFPIAGHHGEIFILDDDRKPVKKGETGELCIGGVSGRQNGYYASEALNAEKYFEHPEHGRLYMTGDLAQEVKEGELLLLGRKDSMMKLFGIRIEPDAIEKRIMEFPGIRQSAVKVIGEGNDARLWAWYCGENVNEQALRRHLAVSLPSYMIPSFFVRLDELPLNYSGKLDRNRLTPDLSVNKAAYENSENRIEEAIRTAMQEVLHIDRADRNDSFLELGGDSIDAAALSSISGLRGLSTRDIMLGQTPAGIALQYEKNADMRKPVLDHKYKPEREYPMTLSNHYFFYNTGSIGEPIDWTDLRFLFRLDRTVDEGRLKQAIEESLMSHRVYGIRFSPSGMILRNEAYDTTVGEVTVEPEKFGAYRMKKSSQRRDLLRQALFDLEIVHAGKTRFLYMNISHLVADQVSINLLYDEISDRYEGREPVRENYDFFDVAAYEGELKGSVFHREALRFFDRQFGSFKGMPAGASENHPICSVSREIGCALSQAQKTKFLKQNEVSDSTYIQAALFLTLAKFLGQDRLICQIFHNGRDTSAYDNLHGCVARGVLVRADIDRTKATGEFLNELQKTWQDTVYYDVIPIQELVERYPQAGSCISMNYRGKMKRSFHLGEKQFPSLPLGYLPGLKHRQAWLQFYIDELEDGRLAIELFGEGYFSYQETERLVSAFERTLGLILVCERVDDILKRI